MDNKIRASISYGVDSSPSSFKHGSFSFVPKDTFVAIIKIEKIFKDADGNNVVKNYYHRLFVGFMITAEGFIDTYNKNGSNLSAMALIELKEKIKMGNNYVVVPNDSSKINSGVFAYLDVEMDAVYSSYEELVAGVEHYREICTSKVEIIEPTTLEDDEEIHRKNS